MLTVSTTASQSKKWLPPPTSSTSLPTVLKTIPSSTVTRTWTTSPLTVTVLSQRTSSLNSKRPTTSWMLKSSTITRKSLRRVRRRKDMTRWSQFKKPYLKTTTVMSHTTLLTLKTHMECQSMMNTFQFHPSARRRRRPRNPELTTNSNNLYSIKMTTNKRLIWNSTRKWLSTTTTRFKDMESWSLKEKRRGENNRWPSHQHRTD